MARETKESPKTRKELMESLNIPINSRGAFIRFCRRGIGFDSQGYFWDEDRLKWGQYAPVEDRSRVFKTMEQMWEDYLIKRKYE